MSKIVGDFNAEDSEPCLKNFLYQYDAKNIVKQKTCFKSTDNPSCIDLFLTNSYRTVIYSVLIAQLELWLLFIYLFIYLFYKLVILPNSNKVIIIIINLTHNREYWNASLSVCRRLSSSRIIFISLDFWTWIIHKFLKLITFVRVKILRNL